jgi:hypothetical protein
LIFIDQTWAKTNMTRLHGRPAKGGWLIGKVLHGHRKTLTFVAGLRCDGIIAPCVFDAIDAESFLAWLLQFLVPDLPGRHRCDGQPEQSQEQGRATDDSFCRRQTIFPPPYSPDLNPIEQAFSKLPAPQAERTDHRAGGTMHRATAPRDRAGGVSQLLSGGGLCVNLKRSCIDTRFARGSVGTTSCFRRIDTALFNDLPELSGRKIPETGVQLRKSR